ncbi:MAG: pyridoxamine 5'-phosphate oxidase family protein, partial [Dehalococcoidia bacterium]|nr:pyridoxamine 5'-phosphate oxidase family protein [Dehalococcoidia bacterium]
MARTFIVYETRYGSTEEAVKKMALILGPARYCRTTEFKPEYRDNYDFFVLGAGVYVEAIDPRLSNFVTANKDWLTKKKVALFATCLSGIRGLNYVAPLARMLGECVVITGMVDGKFKKDQLTPEDYAIMKQFYETVKMPFEDTDRTNLPRLTEFCLKMKAIKDADYKAMPAGQLKTYIEEFITSHNTCVLGTGSGNQVRTTPVTFKYHEGHIYIVSEGGRKFVGLLANPNVSITIHNETDSGKFARAGLQLTGTASIIAPYDPEHRQVFDIMGLDYQRLSSLPWVMNGIKVKLTRAEFRWRGFDEKGYSRVQHYDFQ